MANNAAELRIKPVLVGSLQEIFGPLHRELSALGSVRPFGSPGGSGGNDIVAPLREIPNALKPARQEMRALVVEGDVWAQKFGELGREVTSVAKEQAEGMNEGRRAVERVGQSYDDTREKARRTKHEIGDLGKRQKNEMTEGRRSVDLLTRSYRGLSHAAGNVRNGLKSVVDSVFSIRGAMVGVATGMVGRTLFDAMIGSNAKLEQQRVTFNAMLGDAEKADQLLGSIRDYAASTPFAQDDLITGSRTLLRVTKDNIGENERLLRVAGNMAAMMGEGTTIADAAEALAGAATGETERLKRFGIVLRAEDIQRIRKSGETAGEAAIRGAIEQFETLTKGEDLVGKMSQGFIGRLSTLKDNFRLIFQEAGRPAFAALSAGLDDALTGLTELRSDPRFMKDMEEFGELMGNAARYASEIGMQLFTKVPDAARAVRDTFREAKAFYDKHPRLVQFLVGSVAANKLSGGLLAQAGGAALRGGVGMLRRRGRGGVTGDAFETVASAAGGSCCCCEGMGSPGVGGVGGKAATTGGRAAAAALTAAELGSAGLGTGAMVKGAALGVGALALPAAALLAMGKGWANTLEAGSEFGQGNTIVNRMTREDLRADVTRAIENGEYDRAHGLFVDALGGPGARFGGSAQERESLQEVRRVANNFGWDFDLKEGQSVESLQMEWLRSQGLGGHFRDLTRRIIDVEDDLGQNAGAVMSGINKAAKPIITDELLRKLFDSMKHMSEQEKMIFNIDLRGRGEPEDVRRAAEEGVQAALDRQTREQRART